jgi:putative peptide zinc metalloprotease protein
MNSFDAESTDWLCPNLRSHWRLRQAKAYGCWVLQATATAHRLRLQECEVYALRHFTGDLTVGDVQQLCQEKFGDRIPPNFVLRLLAKLVKMGVLVPDHADAPMRRVGLKAGVRWSQQWDGQWILGSPDGKHHIQVLPQHKPIVEQIGQMPNAALAQRHGCDPIHVNWLTQMLQKQMLEGMELPATTHRKWTPFSLLFIKKPLLNPDRWLARQITILGWVWSAPVLWLLCSFLGLSAVMATAQSVDITFQGQVLIQAYGWRLLLPFGLLSMLVVSLHELAHAFTLKHFGGLVSEMGLLFMCLIPAAYTNSSDSYLVSRWQRCLVVGAGVLCQIVIAAIAFWVWFSTANSSSIHTGAYLLMVAALFTVALNLNPLAKFDGYYLLAAVTGINNLKGRSFTLYRAWLNRQSSPEVGQQRWILAAYAPLSFLYLLLVFGRLLLWLVSTILTHAPYLTLSLFGLWLIYYIYPTASDEPISQPRQKIPFQSGSAPTQRN